MEKNFQRAILVGKFCPLHKGHEFLIQTALAQTQELFIYSYTSADFPNCSTENRLHWLETLFPDAHSLVLDSLNIKTLGFNEVPSDMDSEDSHRYFVARLYHKTVGKPLDAIYTSESYGDGFTQVMSHYLNEHKVQSHAVIHVNVDQARSHVPISGTEIRKDPYRNRDFLSSLVYRSFLKRILFLGGESTGKSTLTELCAEKYRTVFVDEYGRTRYEQKKGKLVFEDLLTIALIHKDREWIQIKNAREFLFVDTSPMTTLFYSNYLFAKADPKLESMAEDLNYDHIFLCAPDFPMIQDGTRVDEAFRRQQHDWYVGQLEKRNLTYTELRGSLPEKVNTIHSVLLKLRGLAP